MARATPPPASVALPLSSAFLALMEKAAEKGAELAVAEVAVKLSFTSCVLLPMLLVGISMKFAMLYTARGWTAQSHQKIPEVSFGST